MSTRLTENRGFDAVAITVIRYRSSDGDTFLPSFCHGWPVGTKMTSSRREEVRDLAGGDQVAVMDRVERAAHHPDPDLAGPVPIPRL